MPLINNAFLHFMLMLYRNIVAAVALCLQTWRNRKTACQLESILSLRQHVSRRDHRAVVQRSDKSCSGLFGDSGSPTAAVRDARRASSPSRQGLARRVWQAQKPSFLRPGFSCIDDGCSSRAAQVELFETAQDAAAVGGDSHRVTGDSGTVQWKHAVHNTVVEPSVTCGRLSHGLPRIAPHRFGPAARASGSSETASEENVWLRTAVGVGKRGRLLGYPQDQLT